MTTLAQTRPPRARGAERVRGAVADLDWVLLAIVAAITGFGIFVIHAATGDDVAGSPDFYVARQALYAGIGVALMVLAAGVDADRLARYRWFLWGGLLVSLVVVYGLGEAVRGSNRWITIGPLNLQPSEIGKLVMVVVLAGIVAERRAEMGRPRFTLLLAGVALLPTLIVFAQPDLGTALVYAVVFMAVLFLGGAPWTHLAAFAGAAALLVGGVLWLLPASGVEVLKPYQTERLTAFLGSTRDASDAGYQLDQSTTAAGSGAVLGKGPNGASQTINDFLPEHHTDFIFAVTAEMFGFVGAAGLILLFALLIWRSLRIVARASSQVDQLVAGGIVGILVFQVFVNIGMTVGLMPITGIPLPLMSFGGSHMLTTLMAVGLLLGIHRRRSPVAV